MPKPASTSKKAPKRPPKRLPPAPANRRILRPSDLDPRDRKQLMGMLGIGVPYVDACHAVGLHPARYREWMDERHEDEDVVAFREEAQRADGRGVAQQVKLLWDGGRTTQGPDGNPVVEMSKTLCEQHRFLLSRRRPQAFAPSGEGGRRNGNDGQGARSGDPVEQDVAEQIVAVLTSAGVVLPPEVLAVVGVVGR